MPCGLKLTSALLEQHCMISYTIGDGYLEVRNTKHQRARA